MSVDTTGSVNVPLCVDLDGTLIRTDSLVETTALFMKQHFLLVVLFPFWLLSGRARFKEEIAARTELDVAFLPYEDTVLETIREARAAGRHVSGFARGARARRCSRARMRRSRCRGSEAPCGAPHAAAG